MSDDAISKSALEDRDVEKSASLFSSASDATQRGKIDENSSPSSHPEQPPEQSEVEYLQGLRFYLILSAMLLSVFLVNLEITILSTSLVSISNSLGNFQQSSWIINAYMVTFTGFVAILAKLSDIFGRKTCLLLSLAWFVIFSGGCAAAQTMIQLILLRAFQGIGAAGANGILRIMFFEMVPPAKFAGITGVVTGVYALCYLVGPLLGGVINDKTTWRWVFLINVPTGILAMVILALALPNGFPRKRTRDTGLDGEGRKGKLGQMMRRIDYVAMALLLAATVLLVTGLEESGMNSSWTSAPSIVMFVVSGLAWIGFLGWSWWQSSRSESTIEPAFPWRLLTNKACVGMLLVTTIAGAPLLICAVSLPLRFQSVNGLSPLEAGIRLLPYSVAVPVGSTVSSLLVGRVKILPVHLMLFGSLLQILGLSLLGWASPSVSLRPSFYGYQVIVGFGIGIVLTAVTVAVQFVVEKRDRAVANGATVQFRLIGGAIGLAVVTAVFNSHSRSSLKDILTSAELSSILSSSQAIKGLPDGVVGEVRSALVNAYSLEFRISVGFSVAQVASVLLLWTKRSGSVVR